MSLAESAKYIFNTRRAERQNEFVDVEDKHKQRSKLTHTYLLKWYWDTLMHDELQ